MFVAGRSKGPHGKIGLNRYGLIDHETPPRTRRLLIGYEKPRVVMPGFFVFRMVKAAELQRICGFTGAHPTSIGARVMVGGGGMLAPAGDCGRDSRVQHTLSCRGIFSRV